MRGSWRLNRTATYWPHSIGHQHFFPVLLACSTGGLVFSIASYPRLVWSPTAQSGAWGLPLLGPGFLYRILSPTGLVSKLTDFLSSPSYIIVQRPPSCGHHNRTHSTRPWSKLYSDIPWVDVPVIYISAFPILTARPGRKLIYNTICSLSYIYISSIYKLWCQIILSEEKSNFPSPIWSNKEINWKSRVSDRVVVWNDILVFFVMYIK